MALAGGLWWLSSPPGPVGPGGRSSGEFAAEYTRYVGDAACRGCHPVEAAAYVRSGHARTLRPAAKSVAARRLVGRKVADPERPGSTWGFALGDGRFVAEYAGAGGGEVERFLVDYAFGSGHHATTFVSLLDRDPAHPVALEHRMTYYAHTRSPGLTPGQSLSGHATGNSPEGRTHTASDTLKCFGCHATVTSDRGPDALDEATMIANVSCERCHGPGRSHVEA